MANRERNKTFSNHYSVGKVTSYGRKMTDWVLLLGTIADET